MNFNGSKTKSNQKAETLRKQAVKAFLNGELYEALMKFNKSLCHAEPSTKTIGLIYANRAEVYFRLKLYDKCLHNLELAKDDYCPKEIMSDHDEMKESCLNLLGQTVTPENPWEFFKLSHPSKEKLPYVIDSLEVKCDKKYGRYIITNQALNVGDIIAIENPFFKILKVDPDDDEYPETNVYQYCAYCMQDNLLDLFPCSDCLTTMFCSRMCLYSATRGFHQYECSILQPLNETGNWRMTLRCFFDSLSICNSSIEELEKLVIESDELTPTVFNFDFSKYPSRESAKNQLMCMLSLERRVEVKVKDFSSLFLQNPKLANIWESHKVFINKFLERMMQIEILNFHGIKGRSLNRSKPYRSCLGDGGYTFCSLINHSCCPNTMRIVVDNRMVLVVERPIKIGDQIFDCYIGDSFYFKTKQSRRKELMDYQFVCDCDACKNDFPEVMTGELEAHDVVLHSFAQKYYNELRDPRKILTTERAKELAIKYSNLMQKNYRDENYPCREIVLLQLCIIKCFLQACKSTINFP